MFAMMESMTGLEMLFAGCAVFGATLFVIRLVLMFMGIGDSHPGDVGAIDAGHLDHTGDFHDSDISFKALSLQGITAFFMMFGLIGWAVIRQGDYAPWVPIVCGTAAGAATVWLMKKIFQMAGMLQSSGTLNLENAVGQQGSVYLTIRPGSSGKVQVTVQNQLSVLEAVTDSKEEIKTGESVRVVRIAGGKLVVEKISA